MIALAEKSTLDWITLVLVIVGGLNWGLVGLIQLDLVELILGSIPILQRIVYVLVGVSAAYMAYAVTRE
ncbi:DUF378 domain-containing protein [Halobacteriota archaeon]